MKKLLLTLLMYSLIALSAYAQNMSYNGVKQNIIIDVRTPAEFATRHINGAVNIPLDQIDSGIPPVHGLHRESRILLYCRSGQRSATARKLMEKQGYLHVQNGGGMDELQQNLKL